MTDERDIDLGASLRALPVPEHENDFFARLAERMAEEDAAGRGPAQRRLRPGPGRVLLSVAAAATLVVSSVAVVRAVTEGDGARETRVATPPTAPNPASPATVTSVSGRVVRSMPGESAVTTDFLLDADGSYRVAVQGQQQPYVAVYDATTGVMAGGSGGDVFARSGVAPGPPDAYPFELEAVLQREIGWTVRARALGGDGAVTEIEHQGRRAWRWEGAVNRNEVAESGNHLLVVVDQQTSIPLEIVERLHGDVVRSQRVEALAVDVTVERASFRLPGAAAGRAEPSPEFERVDLAGVPERAGFDPFLPTTLPEGFERAEVTVARNAGPTGPEGVNAPTGHVVSVAYRRGIDVVVVTTRPRGGNDWADPFLGEGQVVQEAEVVVRGGAYDGVRARMVLDPQTVPHAWVVGARSVVTIGGTLGRAELEAALGSLQKVTAGG